MPPLIRYLKIIPSQTYGWLNGRTQEKSNEWIENKLKGISQTIRKLCELSQAENVDTAEMALMLARDKIKRSYIS